MGLPSGFALHARDRDGARGLHDRGQAAAVEDRQRRRRVAAGLILVLAASPAAGETLRVATFNVELARGGPGLLLRDILKGEDEQVRAAASVIARADPDILLLTSFDHDAGLVALTAFARMIADLGTDYPHLFARTPNAGLSTGRDMDGDGRPATPRDAQGYGEFAGQGGMAILSKLPIDGPTSRDFSAFAWRDLPGALLSGDAPPEGAAPDQRLSSVAHWDVAAALPDGRTIRLWTWHATPPVFDGPEDRNGRRNHDEAAFWLRYLEGALPWAPADTPFVLLGDANLDPADGDGRPEALTALLAHPRITDPLPGSPGGVAAADAGQTGDPALDTADWPKGPGQPGNLRVDYVLPSTDWEVLDAGVWWPASGEDADLAAAASRHRLVWVDLRLP